MTDFGFEVEMDVRFRDIDAMGHVNNAVYATFLEQARARYIEEVVGEPLLENGAVIADLHLDFERPIDWGETVTVALRAEEPGSSSIPLVYEVRADGALAATAETLLVVYDREAGEARAMPEEWRERIHAHEGH